MVKDEYYFMQDYGQSFIRIKCISFGWEKTDWVHYYESVILEDLIELKQSDLDSKCIRESYRKLEYITNLEQEDSIESIDKIRVLCKIPDSIIEKIKKGIYDSEVTNFTFFSSSEKGRSGGRTFSNPIHTKRGYRDYKLNRILNLPLC